jgi:N-acetylmuramoyl-L-alanine amidase
LIAAPDTPLVHALHPSPNIEPRRGMSPSILLLHYTGLPSVERAIDVLSRPDCKVSCHYVIDLDGRITQMVAEDMRAWHAGVSIWEGETDINSASIGIEIQNAGHDAGYPDFPARQMQAVTTLCHDIVRRHAMRPERVLAHSDVAPGRKIDPGEKFDWRLLARRGVGLWVEPAVLDPADEGLAKDTEHPRVCAFQARLADYGYGVPQHGRLDDATAIVIAAFQRHFRPARVDGRLDVSSEATLDRLLAARDTVRLTS